MRRPAARSLVALALVLGASLLPAAAAPAGATVPLRPVVPAAVPLEDPSPSPEPTPTPAPTATPTPEPSPAPTPSPTPTPTATPRPTATPKPGRPPRDRISPRDRRQIQRVVRIAKAQVGDPYLFGSLGPFTFDCSGLVYYAFRQASQLHRVGGEYRTAALLYAWGRSHDRFSRRHARRGDLVIYGRGVHVGIYLGQGMAASAIRSGVRIHPLRGLIAPFTGFVRIRR